MNSINDDGLIIGLKAIGQYVRRSPRTVQRWYTVEAFPLCHLPDGSAATTRSLIDSWMLARNYVERGISLRDFDR